MNVLGTAIMVAFAACAKDACFASADDQQFQTQMSKQAGYVDALRKRIASDPENVFLHRWLMDEIKRQGGSALEEYFKNSEEHANNGYYAYFYGHALMAERPADAIEKITQGAAIESKNPWAYFDLMALYANGEQRNEAKVSTNMLSFTELCPQVFEGYRFLGMVTDRNQLAELARRLRKAVEASRSPVAAAQYSALWKAEFRSADATGFDALRTQVAKDIERIKELDPSNVETLRAGYRLTGNKEAEQALPKPARPRDFATDLDAWLEAHPDPKPDAPQEQKNSYDKAFAEASAQWVKDWPDDVNARNWRLNAMSRLKSTSDEEVERLGDQVLQTLKEHPFKGVMFFPFQSLVAQVWNERNVRLQQSLGLTDEAMAEIERARKANPIIAQARAPMIENGVFNVLSLQFDLALKLKNYEKAKSALAQMKQSLDEHPRNFPNPQEVFWRKAGRLAEAEGRKLDALSYYQALTSQTTGYAEERAKAQMIWTELGGTEDGRAIWSSLQIAKRPLAADKPVAWGETNKPLENFAGFDLGGRGWSVRNFKGKTTVVNVWASWCGPCRAELPAVQKLFDQWKDRKDVQLVTIDVDDNPGLAEPVVRDKGYTFPVIFIQYSWLEGLVGLSAIPQTWIVDEKGVIRLERSGYDAADWPQGISEKAASVK